MSEMKHTPGPWTIHLDKYRGQKIFRVEGAEYCICPTVSTEADTRLIAAAPEMLELLEDLIDQVWLPNTTHDRIETLLSKIKNQTDEPTD